MSASDQLKFGITLSNRGVVLGTRTPKELLALADKVEGNPLFDSVWVGDALFVNRRLDAIPLLAAIARAHRAPFLDRYYSAGYTESRLRNRRTPVCQRRRARQQAVCMKR